MEEVNEVDLGFRTADGDLVAFTYDGSVRLTVDEVGGQRVRIEFEDAAYVACIAIDDWPSSSREAEDRAYEVSKSDRVRELAAEDAIYAGYRHWRLHFNGFLTFEVVAAGFRVDR